MWLKLFFLLLYFMVLFTLARIFETVVWYETGVFATQLVDPVTLSFERLRTILECRGLGYSGLAEKKDVSELVERSGNSHSVFSSYLHPSSFSITVSFSFHPHPLLTLSPDLPTAPQLL